MRHSSITSSHPSSNRSTNTPVVICDDVSGACEVAGVLASVGLRPSVQLSHSPDLTVSELDVTTVIDVVVIDLNLRHADDLHAERQVTDVILDRDVRFIKIDSTLRGPIVGMLRGAQRSNKPIALCPALPAAGRTIKHGIPYVNGVPLRNSDAWSAEPNQGPSHISDLVGDFPTIDLPTTELPALAKSQINEQAIVCFDAETEHDLELIANLVAENQMLAVGSAGLLLSIVRSSGENPTRPNQPKVEAHPSAALIVVGSASNAARAQIDHLAANSICCVFLHPLHDDESAVASIRDALNENHAVAVSWSTEIPVEPSESMALASRLASAVEEIASIYPQLPLILTGGHTARTILDRIGRSELRVESVVHHGAVISKVPSGRVVGIRPGSFGDEHSLLDMYLTAVQAAQTDGTS